MAVSFRRIGLATALLAAGALLGPVVFAGIGAALAVSDPEDYPTKWQETQRLVEAYRARLPRGRLYTTIASPQNGVECGYNVAAIFPDVYSESRQFGYWNGYQALDHWRDMNWKRQRIEEFGEAIGADMNEFEVVFLRRCIEATVLQPLCMAKIAGYSDRVSRSDHLRATSLFEGYGYEDQIVCTYVDGVAARRGVPLAEAPRE